RSRARRSSSHFVTESSHSAAGRASSSASSTGRATARSSSLPCGNTGPVSRVVLAVAAAVAVLVLPASVAAARAARHEFTRIPKIRHVVVIMQENRSFDSYFGPSPGADGIPPGVCVPDPAAHTCVKPYHDTSDRNSGGPHDHVDAVKDIDGGKMDGFVAQARS